MWDIHSITIGVWDIQDYQWYVGYTGLRLICGIYSITIGMWDIQHYQWCVGYTGLPLVCGIYRITIGMWDIQDCHWYVGYTLLRVCLSLILTFPYRFCPRICVRFSFFRGGGWGEGGNIKPYRIKEFVSFFKQRVL